MATLTKVLEINNCSLCPESYVVEGTILHFISNGIYTQVDLGTGHTLGTKNIPQSTYLIAVKDKVLTILSVLTGTKFKVTAIDMSQGYSTKRLVAMKRVISTCRIDGELMFLVAQKNSSIGVYSFLQNSIVHSVEVPQSHRVICAYQEGSLYLITNCKSYNCSLIHCGNIEHTRIQFDPQERAVFVVLRGKLCKISNNCIVYEGNEERLEHVAFCTSIGDGYIIMVKVGQEDRSSVVLFKLN